MWHFLEYILLMVPGIILACAVAAALRLAVRRASLVDCMLLGASGATLVILVVLFKLFRTTLVFAWLDGGTGETRFLLACGVMGIANALCVVRMVPSRVVFAFLLLAPPAAMGLAMWFERGTHGRWYIQNEGLALILSIAMWYVSYAVLVGVPLIVWSRREPRLRGSSTCSACGYDRSGLLAGVRCPECGVSPIIVPAEQSATNA